MTPENIAAINAIVLGGMTDGHVPVPSDRLQLIADGITQRIVDYVASLAAPIDPPPAE